LLMAAAMPSAQAAGGWVVHRTGSDMTFERAGQRFSLAEYAARRVPSGYMPGTANEAGCEIDIEMTPLSLQADLLSVWMVYRTQPGDCDPPLRNAGTQAVVALHLPDGEPALLTDALPPDAVLRALRGTEAVRSLAGTAPAASLPGLLAQMDTATRPRCDRRITQASLSQFYLAPDHGTPRLRLAWINDCGQLGDEPALDGIPLDVSAEALPAPTKTWQGEPPLQLSFVPSSRGK